MNFVERKSPKTTIKVRATHIPTVHINEKALQKMFIYTDEVSDEVGWLGTAYRDDNIFYIEDVFLFDQEVHGATTEITPEGLADFATELMQQPDGMEIWNNLKMWGHSHVNMSITPSGQDDKQMEEFSKNGHDFFIRLICNKKGELAVDVYDYKNGLEFHNAPWLIHVDEAENEGKSAIKLQINELYAQIEQLEEAIADMEEKELEALRTPIKEEIKEKVRKLTYSSRKYTTYGTNSKTTTSSQLKMNSLPWQGWTPRKKETSVKEDQIDGVKGTIYDFFTHSELVQYANTCWTYEQFLEDMELDGYTEMLSIRDLDLVWKTILELQDDMDTYNGAWRYY